MIVRESFHHPVGPCRPSLSAADLRRVLATVLRLNACATIPALSRDGVAALLELIPADTFSLQLMRLNGEPIITVSDPHWPFTRAQVQYYRAHAADHPMVRHYTLHGDGYALRMSDVVPVRALRRNHVYRHCMAPHGLLYVLGLLVPVAPGHRLGVAFDRRARDFSLREVALLEALRAHLVQLVERLELHDGRKRPWREPSARDWLAGDLGVSNREAEALLHLADGHDNAAIARALGIALPTLKKHLENAYAKLGVSGRHAAAQLVMQKLGRLR